MGAFSSSHGWLLESAQWNFGCVLGRGLCSSTAQPTTTPTGWNVCDPGLCGGQSFWRHELYGACEATQRVGGQWPGHPGALQVFMRGLMAGSNVGGGGADALRRSSVELFSSLSLRCSKSRGLEQPVGVVCAALERPFKRVWVPQPSHCP